MTLFSETVKRTRSDIEIRVGSAESEEQNTGVQNAWQDLDTSKPDSDGERRCGSLCLESVGESKILGIVWHEHAEEKDR